MVEIKKENFYSKKIYKLILFLLFLEYNQIKSITIPA